MESRKEKDTLFMKQIERAILCCLGYMLLKNSRVISGWKEAANGPGAESQQTMSPVCPGKACGVWSGSKAALVSAKVQGNKMD